MKSWYMDNYTPNISGYESDPICEYAQSNFSDILTTDFADSVILYNHDLSEQRELRCIIQNNVSDSKEKSMERQILCPIDTLKAGMYIYYNNNYWLVTGRPGNNKSYEKSTLLLCEYPLRWQNANGEIINRWCGIISGSASSGESGNSTIVVKENQFAFLLPNDDECLALEKSGTTTSRRVFIDKRTPPRNVYNITNENNVQYDYGDLGGVVSFIAERTEFNKDTDNPELGICEYISINEEPEISDNNYTCEITYRGSDTIIAGGTAKTLTATFIDSNANTLSDVDFSWDIQIDDEFRELLYTEIRSDNKCKIKLDYDNLLAGNYIKVCVIGSDNTVFATKIFEIGDGV